MPLRTMFVTLLLAAAFPAQAQELDARYDLSLRGITGGQIALAGRQEGAGYSVGAEAKATGLVGTLLKYGYEGRARGQYVAGRPVSQSYSEIENDDGERTEADVAFRGTRPAAVTFTPPREPRDHDIDPTAQRGVIDPLSALYDVMRPTTPSRACNRRYDLFDGRHVSRLTLGQPAAGADGTIRCAGEYRRIAGYAPERLAERPVVRLDILYAPAGPGAVAVSEVRSPTRFGDAVLRRR
ncbi:DUF3108 domain-containing protein [uncultured Jannaschia sp.]|uniref:DUF3108 domain-containing protein n=1 Tax=uncultured Jannaschia sp. TaxID=293347 RepID=UPI002621A8D5|nr:DUF3108 domain-containing protein [uncultured Jannaschia sp.]